MGIRQDLHPIESNGKNVLPPPCYSMSKDEKKKLCRWLLNLKVPDGHSSNISQCVIVGETKISGMKTHDCHVFLERLLPLIVREMLPRHVSDAVIELCIHNLDEIHRLEFVGWFNQRITQLYKEGQVCKLMLSLARGPEKRATYYPGYNVNGFRFDIINQDETRKTQINGVVVKWEIQTEEVSYYGRNKDIVELCYTVGNKVVLFDCDWFDTSREGRGYKRDRYEIVTVNIKRKLNTQDTFVLACQANQVYYTKGLLDNSWNAVNEIKPRNLYEMPVDGEPYQEETQFNSTNVNKEGNENEEDEIDSSRVEADAMIVE
ncbi:hypothetical protein Ddye_020289 [Dipteronia dyeriana]|uniref:DUF4216 domain-containing protein n=1 Tax=Dipteronia dyeriana TaxID=168575 RepID=A0AAD9U0F7_9ROSI|nr:hypothetical protein Ddye_020289 [Dipteronia dyeriana]